MVVARLLKASDDESSRSLVNVICRDLKDTLDSAVAAVAAVTVVALLVLAMDMGNAVEPKGVIAEKYCRICKFLHCNYLVSKYTVSLPQRIRNIAARFPAAILAFSGSVRKERVIPRIYGLNFES